MRGQSHRERQIPTDLADLVYTHPGAPTEIFIGDPSIPHTVTGSPIGINRFEVEYLGRLADRVIVMYGGAVMEEGATSAVFAGLTFGAASPSTHSPSIRFACISIVAFLAKS